MELPRADVVAILRHRRDEPAASRAEAVLPDPVDTERDLEVLTGLGLGIGDLIKEHGARGASVTICGPSHGLS